MVPPNLSSKTFGGSKGGFSLDFFNKIESI